MQQQHQSTTDDEDDKNNTTTMVSPGFETSTLLSSIYTPSLTTTTTTTTEGEDGSIGSNKFMVAYCINLERLCLQAHWTAGLVGREQSTVVNISNGGVGDVSIGGRDGSSSQFAATPGLDDVLSSLTTGGSCNSNTNNKEEEYVVQAFLDDTDKIECLVKTLLLLELWRENVLFPNKKNKQQCSDNSDKNDYNDEGVAAVAEEEEEEVEFEIEGGERDEDEYYNELNDVDGGNIKENNNNANTTNDVAISNTTTANNGEGGEETGLANRLANNGNALRTAFILHAETTIVSLLSLIFFRGVPPELLEGSNGGSGEDVLLSLVDYCARQLVRSLSCNS